MANGIKKIVDWITQNLSRFIIFLILVVVVLHNFNHKLWLREKGIVKHDVISYYSYLPAAIIYNDLSFRFIDDNRAFFHDKIWIVKTPEGMRYQKMTMGLSFMYLPFFLAGHAAALIIGAEPNGFSTPYMFFLQFSSLFYMLLGLIILRRLLLRHFHDWITALVLFALVFGTNLFYYTTREAAMPHAFNFFLFALFIWITIKWHEQQRFKYALALGLVFGLISLIRPSNALIAVFFMLYDVKSFRELGKRPLLFIKKWKHILIIIFSAFLVFVPQFIFWKTNTGSWFLYSYGDEGFFFTNPQIINGLFSYRKGWLVYTPLMIIALIGIFMLVRKQKQFFTPILVFTILNIYVIYSWWCWWYGGSFGSRPMIDSYPMMAIALAGFIDWFAVSKVRKITIIGILVILSGHGIFQTLQYQKSAIHYDSMSKEAYWHSFGKLFPDHYYYDLLEPPDYKAAKRGEQAIAVHSKTIITEPLVSDYEIVTPDGNSFFSTNMRYLIGKASLKSDEMSRSGHNSIKLTPEHQYGSDFLLRARAQEVYRLSVWRYPAQSEGRLVFSATREADFYRAFRNVVEIDEQGWGKVETEITIPSQVHGYFKIYLWNPGSEPVFFDDLMIERVSAY
jgi:hypothetical protein